MNLFIKLISLTLISLSISSCVENQSQELPKTISKKVIVKKVDHKNISFPISATGILESKNEKNLSFLTGGIISNIHVVEGQQVSKGQTLASLNRDEFISNRNKAEEAIKQTKRDLERTEKLYNENIATKEQLENLTTLLDVQRSDLKIATYYLNQSIIKAPNNGKIYKVYSEENEIIGKGMPVLIFASNNSSWIIQTALTDVDIFKIKQQNKSQIEFDAFPNKSFDATVSSIYPKANPMTGLFSVELELKESGFDLRSGLIANIIIENSNSDDLFFIPMSAIKKATESTATIFRVSNNKAQKVDLKIEKLSNDGIYTSYGLNIGDKIIIDGNAYLKDNDKISILNKD